MNAITKAISDVKSRIPRELLELAYAKRSTVLNIESILESVIKKRVMVDADLVGGVTLTVDMAKAVVCGYDDAGGMVVDIPRSVLNGRQIISVHSLVEKADIVGYQQSGYQDPYANSLEGMASMVYRNSNVPQIELTSNIDVVNDNRIHIKDKIYELHNTTLRLVVGNLALMRNLPPRAFIAFSKLVTYAIKADIYNTLDISLDKGALYAGQSLTSIGRRLSEYSDMEEIYMKYLELEWTKVAFMVDNTEMESYIKGMFPNV